MGFIPDSVAEMLNLKQIQFQKDGQGLTKQQSSSSTTTTSSSSSTSIVKELESEDVFEQLIASGNKTCMKFTAGKKKMMMCARTFFFKDILLVLRNESVIPKRNEMNEPSNCHSNIE
jgi:hypothetical protein